MQTDRTKPSTACEPCRKRRAKCDRRRPSCMQCLKTSRTCTGYREQLDLVLRDESVKFRAHGQTGKKSSSSSGHAALTVTPDSNAVIPVNKVVVPESNVAHTHRKRTSHIVQRLNSTEATVTVQNIEPLAPPAPCKDDLAINFFIHNFQGGMYLDYLPLLNKASNQYSGFRASFEAVAMCFFAKSKSKFSLWPEAMQKYSVALQRTTAALSTEQDAARDDGIASVMLLALFTAISTQHSSETSRIWTSHLQGAMALIGMRPAGTFNGPMFQALLSHVINSVHLDCLYKKVSLPPQMPSLYKLSIQARNPFQVKFWQLIRELTEFKRLQFAGELSDLEALNEARSLDQKSDMILRAIPAIHRTEEGSDFIRSPVHKHSEFRAVQVLNSLRLIRIDLLEYMVTHGTRYLLLPDSGDVVDRQGVQNQIKQASETLLRLTEDICDSIPIKLQGIGRGSQSDSNAWICTLLWPLARGAQSIFIPESLRTRIQQQLETIAEITDNTQISNLALQAMKGRSGLSGIHMLYLS